MRARRVAVLLGLAVMWTSPLSAARDGGLQGPCSLGDVQPGFSGETSFRVLLTRLAGPAESVRTAKDQWLPLEQVRVRQIGMAGSTLLRGTASSLPGDSDLEWVRTSCFVQGPGAAEAVGRHVAADVVFWGDAACTPDTPHDLRCARGGSPEAIRVGLTVITEVPRPRLPGEVWRPASLPHPLSWEMPLRDQDGGEGLLYLVQGLERLQQGLPGEAAVAFKRAGERAAGLWVDALVRTAELEAARRVAESERVRAEAVGGARLARALVSLAGVSWSAGYEEGAREALRASITVAEAVVGARDVEAHARLQLAVLDEQAGDLVGAEAAYAALVEYSFQAHDRSLRAEVHAGLGRTRQRLGQLDAAHRAWKTALLGFEEGSDPWAYAAVLDGLGATAGHFERQQRAEWFHQARRLWLELGQEDRAVRGELALLALAAESDAPVRESPSAWKGRLEASLAAGARLQAWLEAAEDSEGLAVLHGDLARTAVNLDRVEEARTWLVGGAVPLEELAVLKRELADVLRSRGEGSSALALYLEAWEHAEEVGMPREQARTAERIADLQRKVLRDVVQAYRWAERTLSLHAEALEAEAPPVSAEEWARVGDVAMFVEAWDQALDCYLRAEAVDVETSQQSDPQLPCKVGWALASQERFEEAVAAYERGVEVALVRGSEGLVRSCKAGAQRSREAALSRD